MRYKRVLVTGNAGSGKSTLAKKIAEQQELPYFGLDGVVWGPGWVKRTDNQIHEQISAIISKEIWVIDGVSLPVMKAAEVIIFLDVPRRVAYWRTAKRNYKYMFRSRPGLPEKCPELLILPKLTKIIWRFPKKVRPKILAAKSVKSVEFFHIRSNEDLAECMKAISAVRLK